MITYYYTHLVLVFISIACFSQYSETSQENIANTSNNQANKDDSSLVILIENNNKQQSELASNTRGSDGICCQGMYGPALKECMEWLGDKEYQATFFNLNAQARKNYFESLGFVGHTNMLKRFTKQEWDILYEKLSHYQRKFLPKTYDEQTALLSDCLPEEKTYYILTTTNYVLSRIFRSKEDLDKIYERRKLKHAEARHKVLLAEIFKKYST